MADTDTSNSDERFAALVADRLAAARIPLGATALVLAVGAALGLASLDFAAIAFVVVLFATGFLPRRAIVPGARRAALASGAVWPGTSIKAVVAALQDPAIVLDRTGVVRFLNERASSAFPLTRVGNLLALTFRSPDLVQAITDVLEGRRSSVQYNEGGQGGRTFSVVFSPIHEPSGGDAFALVVFDDITDRLAVARMRSDFVANASHELRTPLASLTGFIETLLGPARNDPAVAERFLRIMLEQANRMRRLLDDLLSLSRLEMRVHRRPTESVDVVTALRHVVDALAPVAERYGVEVTLDLPDRPVAVRGEPDELVQVFQNLVENAIKYGASGKKVAIKAERICADGGRDQVRVRVRDHGPGIAAEHIPRLTERFYRVDVGASRELQGTGLGLAIVKHILTRHRGTLAIESELGRGSEFTVLLPAVVAEVENANKPNSL
ncbi:ATP-binding protein [Propylenella binzhouense]|uniref:histidine kinase n=1 Tax=Propylenella binzhouense TaxID=2555902 RepID=A0A964T7I3_9HYPH|nr:ATP-binding protein [Propylenella binzhouense]MYZ49244.1 hypothetical protein [Propylenella binzhouense]